MCQCVKTKSTDEKQEESNVFKSLMVIECGNLFRMDTLQSSLSEVDFKQVITGEKILEIEISGAKKQKNYNSSPLIPQISIPKYMEHPIKMSVPNP